MEDKFSKLLLDNQLCFPLYAASRLATKIYEPFLSELDITYPQYLVLMVLWEHGEMNVNEIGQRLLLEHNTLTPLLKRMELKKIIQRKRSEIDERKVIVSLTLQGEKIKNQAVTIPERLANAITNQDLTKEEILTFQKTLQKVILTLNKCQ
ncbi:MAG: MarR family transcriptional regulator [Sphingobacteriaceae bacterium]|nr:MarR family transcriptional regulator [Sphingobacteriaceae bacterium]